MLSYDGEADDPPPPTKSEPVPPTPDLAPLPAEPVEAAPRGPDTPAGASDDFNLKTEPDAAADGMQGAYDNQHAMKQEPMHDYDKPISIKDDGYV